ncbi:hypothetical protein L484_027885 [Morus notabilis]|uniref:Uncharacterized protein n=1 Tax=Morus notabilis TaxID=981085 RepID=W9S7C4_9ROSA|nr:hypothetical protein L484_027885 [Morus notabilis]
MAARNVLGPTSQTTLSLPSSASENPDSGDVSQTPTAADYPVSEDPDSTREPKKRRCCPKALEQVEELLIGPNSNPNLFSFSFDTKFSGCSPEITPKFGSFNLVVSNSAQNTRNCKKEAEGKDQTQNPTGSSSETVEETKQD